MQICYRCDKETDRLLAMDAQEKGISKNRLIDGIIQDYLRGDSQTITAHSTAQAERELLSHIRSADERLAQIWEGIGRSQACAASQNDLQGSPQTSPQGGRSDSRPNGQADDQLGPPVPFGIFRRQLIETLLDIAKDLEEIHKGWEDYRRRMATQDPFPIDRP